jgi:di/tricarboxylate transporter
MFTFPRMIVFFTTAVALFISLFPPAPFSPQEARAASLTIFAIGLWATGVLPLYLTALGFFLLAMLFSIAPSRVIFSGFASAAMWLVFGGLVIGVSVGYTGLGKRIASGIARRLNGPYVTVIGGMVLVGVVIGFLVPSSMGRIVLLIPIAVALSDHFGFSSGSNGRAGIILATAFGCHVPTSAILPSNLPNIVLVGAAESIYNIKPLYGEYLLLHFPVLGILKSLAIIALIIWLYPDQPNPRGHKEQDLGPMSATERQLSLVLLVALGFWMTDFLHHVSPGWIALAAALVLLLPRTGFLPARAFVEKINYGTLFFVAGIMGLGAMVAETGLGRLFALGLMAVLPLKAGAPVQNFASLAMTSNVVALGTTLPGVPAILTPLAGQMAEAAGLPVKTVLMSQVLGFSNPLFPYQSPPIMVAMELGGEPVTRAVKLCLGLGLLTIVFLLPIDFLWWRLLGWI